MISVIIPSYNRVGSIERSAKSVLDQTYRDIELIIVDDCSTDNTREVVCALAQEDPRVRYIRHEINQGACAARNTGIEAAKGEYIAFQDSDDAWRPEKLERQMTVMKTSGADVLFCKYIRIKDGSYDSVGPEQYMEGFLNPVVDVWGIGTQTLLGRRYVFEKFRFDTELPRFQDLELLIRITGKYRIYCMDEPLVEYVIDSADSISCNSQRLYQSASMIKQKHPNLTADFPQMGIHFANALLGNRNLDEEKQIVRKRDICKLALWYKCSWKNLMKSMLIMLGLYDTVRKVRRKGE